MFFFRSVVYGVSKNRKYLFCFAGLTAERIGIFSSEVFCVKTVRKLMKVGFIFIVFYRKDDE